MKQMNFYLYYILPIIIYCTIIFYYSSQPTINGPIGTLIINDKIKHAIAYLILSILIFRATQKTKYKKYSYLISIIFSTLYGISDEFHQYFVPGRMMSIYDIFANFLGSVLILIKKISR